MPIIGLMGFEFESANKGCEALSYSFLSVLNSMYRSGNLQIYDFSNQGIGLIQETYPDVRIKQVNLKIKDPKLSMIRALIECDIVYDVTMGDSFSDIYSKDVCLSDMRFKTMAEIFAKKYILLPQTYGPFSDATVLKKAKQILRKADAIFYRDEMSRDYLEEACQIKAGILVTDLAFLLPFKKNKYRLDLGKFKLGINVSGLLWRGGFTENNQFNLQLDYQKYIRLLIEHYSRDKDEIEIYLIPHVIDMARNAHDDDYRVCKQLCSEYTSIQLSPVFRNAVDAKSYISNLDCFIGARMHSTVASISSGVATIPVSYSRKFEGLYDSIEYPYIIHAKSMTTEQAYKKTMDYVKNHKTLLNSGYKSIELVKRKLDVLLEWMNNNGN